MAKWSTDRIVDVIQWFIIIALIFMLIVQCRDYERVKKNLVTSEEYNRQNTYVRIYESQKLDKLKKENRELYDSISKLQDVESGMIIKFVEHYNTDTVRGDYFTVERDSTNPVNTVYHYKQDNDTVNLSIDVKANNLEWVTADLKIHDKFVIVNREKDGVNQTTIDHSTNTDIEGTAMWHRKEDKKWYQRFTVSPQVGLGYGLINRNIDFYIGGGIGYDF